MLNNMIFRKNRKILCNFAQETFKNEYEKDSNHIIFITHNGYLNFGTDKGYV